MKKKNLLILAAAVVILAVVYILTVKPFGTKKAENRDFAIKNPEQITRVFMIRGQQRIDLVKQPSGKWRVNDKYEAWDPRVNELLYRTMTRLDVKNPVPDALYNRVINAMANHATKVEFYAGDEKVKCIYVGGNTPDELGTYMYVEGSDKPFVVHIPGFNGYLSTRFVMDEKEWRTRTVFSFTPNQLQELKVEYPSDREQSFTITRDGDSSHRISSPAVSQPVPPHVVSSYLNQYRSLNVEGFPYSYDREKLDSLLKTAPYCIMSARLTDGSLQKLTVYPKPVTEETRQIYDKEGHLLANDPERYYAFVEGSREPMIIQLYVFGNVMVKAADFTRNK